MLLVKIFIIFLDRLDAPSAALTLQRSQMVTYVY
jgi:hypothetical protein